MKKWLIYTVMCIVSGTVFAQQKKVDAVRTEEKIQLDGVMNEEAWDKAKCTGDFITYEPEFGKTPDQKSKVCILYDDNALYIGAKLFDDKPGNILKEFTMRDDDNGNTDMFIFQLNPNKDSRNMYEFKVTASNVQTDIRVSDGDHDYNWDAVWMSEVSIHDKGWTVEMEIPYSAIRFPDKNVQSWSANFWRVIRRIREHSCWNPVEQEKGPESEQMGRITNLKNINPPLRLSFYPYASTSIDIHSNADKPSYGFSGGMDMKLGISKSHTLDMTLVPDFSQVESDNERLNLSPFETYYSENRPFFTEGLELFEKVGLFYSRRIGKIPEKYEEIRSMQDDGYTIIKNPRYSRLINALKLSGRNENNLGIGMLNAVTANTWATVEDSAGNHKKILTEPWANYNMLVLDQSFGEYSYINITNAHVYRPDANYYSNVLGTAYKVMEKSNRFGLYGKAAWSNIRDSIKDNEDMTYGYMLNAGMGKLHGNWQYDYELNLTTNSYDPNDFGYLQQNNKLEHEGNLSYNKYQPFWIFNKMSGDLDLSYDQLCESGDFVQSKMSVDAYAETRKFLSIWSSIDVSLSDHHDYYEPRVPGRKYIRPGIHSAYVFFSSDYRKTVALDVRVGTYTDFNKREGYWGFVRPRVRVSDKLTLQYGFDFDLDGNDCGYVTNIYNTDSIIFGRRQVNTITNSIDGKWVLNNKMYFDLAVRHYWRTVNYHEYYLLREDGSLSDKINYQEDHDINFNAFNIDFMFSWNFAPGSYLSLMWKNQIYASEIIPENEIFPAFADNMQSLFEQPQNNSISLRILYYLDWQYIL
ncbi:MAG: DUF5916 domain-containing protein [Bacteroidales bacterium]